MEIIKYKMEVRKRKEETSENLIKRFSRKVKKVKIIEEFLEKQYYKKPSQIKREKYFRKLAAIKKQQQKEKALMGEH
jgi:ribosomal protein S21